MFPLSHLPIRLGRSFTRRLLWLESDYASAPEKLAELLVQLGYPKEQSALLSNRKLAGLAPIGRGEFVRYLGSSFSCIIIDAFAGLNPSAVAQAAGTVIGGGVLILLTPTKENWLSFNDPEYSHIGADAEPQGLFLRWLVNHLEEDSAVIRVQYPRFLATPEVEYQPTQLGVYLGHEQRNLVQQLLVRWRGASSCVQVDADRGRGKSSALGLALALQGSFDSASVVITAPDKRALGALIQAYQRLKPESKAPLYRTPAQLLADPNSYQCLMIDEAAALPLPILRQLCERASHIVLASTQHGYEGFSRGYGLRFLRDLQRLRTDFQRLELNQPLRWSQGDPLERWVDETLLLDAEITYASMPEGINELDRTELLLNSGWLNAIYQLLAQAHYRTSPADLRLLLDSGGQRILINVQQGVLVGVVWIAQEGPIEEALAEQIAQGRRRPSGDLLPQSLIHYQGWIEAAQQRFWRVVRIAVAEGRRRRGLGRSMLRTVESIAASEGVDFVGASFAAQSEILNFWRDTGYQLIRIGEGVDPVAAAPAAQVLLPLSGAGKAWIRLYSDDDILSNFNDIGTFNNAKHEKLLESREQRALSNFADHFAPLSLVRAQLIKLFANHNFPLIEQLADENEKLSAAQVKQLRTWVAQHLASNSVD